MNQQNFLPTSVDVVEADELKLTVAKDLTVEDPSIEKARAAIRGAEQNHEQDSEHADRGEGTSNKVS